MIRYRKKLKEERPEEYKRQADRHVARAKKRREEQRIESERKVRSRQAGIKRAQRAAASDEASDVPIPQTPPSTPNSKAASIVDLIEKSTPTTSQILNASNVKKSVERQAEKDIVDATSASMKIPEVRTKIVDKLKGGASNKAAVSRRLDISRNHFYYQSRKGKSPRTTAATKNLVQEYYHNEEVVTVYPNKQKNGSVLRVLKYPLRKVYGMFRTQNPGVTVGKSTFMKWRPRTVKLMKTAKCYQCLCDVCENLKMVSTAIKTSMSRSGLPTPSYLDDLKALSDGTVCDPRAFKCIDRQCLTCGPDMIRPHFTEWIQDNVSNKVQFAQWKRTSDEIVNGKRISKMKRVIVDGYRWELWQTLALQLKSFPLHQYNNLGQLRQYSLAKKHLKPHQAICVVDFAENFTCHGSADAQSTHFARNSVTVHPNVIIFSQDYHIFRDAVDIISDDLSHDADAVYVFVQTLSAHMTKYYPDITDLIIFSDGCGAQYKSKKPMRHLAQNFDIPQNILWNFYGSRHGKGEADGESAVIKGTLTRSIAAQSLTLADANDCYKHLVNSGFERKEGLSRRHLYMVCKAEIDIKRESELSGVCTVPGIRARIHQARSGGEGTLQYRRSSCFCLDNCLHDPGNTWKTFFYPG